MTIAVLILAAFSMPALAETMAQPLVTVLPTHSGPTTRSMKVTQAAGRFKNPSSNALCNALTEKHSDGSMFLKLVTRSEIVNGSGLYVPDDTYVQGQLWNGITVAKLPLTVGEVELAGPKMPGVSDRASYNGHILQIVRREFSEKSDIIRVIQIRTNPSLSKIDGAKYNEYDGSDLRMARPLVSTIECDELCPFADKSICDSSYKPKARAKAECQFKDKNVCSTANCPFKDRSLCATYVKKSAQAKAKAQYKPSPDCPFADKSVCSVKYSSERPFN